MANNYQEAINKALQGLTSIDTKLKGTHEAILKNASALNEMFAKTNTSSLKEFNALLTQKNKLEKNNAELKKKLVTLTNQQVAASKKLERTEKQKLTASKQVVAQGNKEFALKSKLEKQRAKEEISIKKANSAYARLDAELKKVSKDYQDLAAKRAMGEKLSTKELGTLNALEDRLKLLSNAYKRTNNDLVSTTGGVHRTRGAFDSLGFSVAQLTRESPAFINSMNTGFMAISNNIPIFVDEINKLQRANKALMEQGKPQVNILKRVGAAFFSWQSLISAGIVALTIFAPKIIDFISNMGKANDTIKSSSETLSEFDDGMKEQIGTLIGLTARLKDVTISEEERLGIIQKLAQDYPELNQQTLTDVNNTALLNLEIDKYIDLMIKRKQAEETITKLGEQKIKIDKSKIENENRLSKIEESADKGRVQRIKRAAEIMSLDAEQLKQTKDYNTQYSRNFKLEKERDDILKTLTTSQRKYVDEFVNLNRETKEYNELVESLSKNLKDQNKVVPNTVKYYEDLISANQTLINEGREGKALSIDEIRLIQEKNKQYQKQIDLILGNSDASSDEIKALKGTFAYYQRLISKAKERIETQVLSREEYDKEIKKIKEQEDAIDSLIRKLQGIGEKGSIEGLDLDSSGVDMSFVEDIEDTIERINTNKIIPKIDTSEIDRLINKIKALETTKEVFETLTSTFSDIFDIDIAKFDFLFDGLENTVSDWAEVSKEIIGSVLDASLQRYEIELQVAQRTRDQILNNDLATEEQKESARREFEEKERRIKTEQAKKERENNLIKIAVDTAAAIAQSTVYLSNPITAPLFPGIVAAITGIGLAQAAIVASQPLPAFEKGTDNAPEGWAITQERRPEPITDKNGKLKTMGNYGGDSLTYLEKGDKVFKSREDFFKSFNSGNIQQAVFDLNMYSNGEILNQNSVDRSLLNEIRDLKGSNEKVWSEVKRLAKRPINNNVKVELKDKRAY